MTKEGSTRESETYLVQDSPKKNRENRRGENKYDLNNGSTLEGLGIWRDGQRWGVAVEREKKIGSRMGSSLAIKKRKCFGC